MSTLRSTAAIVTFLTLFAFLASPVSAKAKKSKVQAVKGKRYELRDVHGPWMIMVNSFRNVDAAERKTGGMTAWDAADATVYELRQKGIPAYVFLQQQTLDKNERYIARQESVAVMACNFRSQEDPKAAMVLKYIQQKFDPEFMYDKKNGAIFRKTPGRPTPFSRAFITTNPLRSDDDVRRSTVSKEVRQLNAGVDHCLLNNPGKYALLVATFSGNTVIQVAHQEKESHMKRFNETLGKNLDESAQKAWELTEALRQAKRLGYDRDYESWLYHDKFKSYVAIGSFNSKDDPRIAQLKKNFGAKEKINPKTRRPQMTPELMSIPKNPVGGSLPDKLWFFESEPVLIPVPGKPQDQE